MPSKNILEQKQQIVESLAAKIRDAKSGVLVKYEGITVADDTALRAALRKAGVEYTVMKNTLTGKACEIAGYGDMKQYLSGMTAIAIGMEDPIAPAKIMNPNFPIIVSRLLISPCILQSAPYLLCFCP